MRGRQGGDTLCRCSADGGLVYRTAKYEDRAERRLVQRPSHAWAPCRPGRLQDAQETEERKEGQEIVGLQSLQAMFRRHARASPSREVSEAR